MMRRDEGRGFGVAEDKKLELKLGPPGEEDWSSNNGGNHNNETWGSFPSSMASKTQNGKRGFLHTVEEGEGEETWIRNNNGNQKHSSTTWCSTSSQSPCPSGFQQQKHSFLGFPSNSQTLPVLAKESSSQICGQNVSELHNSEKKACSPASANTAVNNNNNSQKRTAPAPVVGWPPIRSFRKNLASSSSKPAPESQDKAPVKETSTVKPQEVCRKGLFVKINMDGVPIGRKVDLKAYDSYDKLSSAVDELFRGLLTAQRDSSSADLNCKHVEEVREITGLLDGSGEYTLVYEDNEGDRMLVGDVPWDMFASAVKRLRVLKSSELSALRLGSNKQGKTQLESAVVK